MPGLMDHTFIALTIFFTVYSQLVMRWQVTRAGQLPTEFVGKAWFVAGLLAKPWVLSALVATFGAGVSWMLAMTKFELSYAYPFIALNYILVVVAAVLFFGEVMTIPKLLGTLLVVVGIAIIARS